MERFLSVAIESVVNQDYPCIDYLVMDAGSTDNLPAILDKYSGENQTKLSSMAKSSFWMMPALIQCASELQLLRKRRFSITFSTCWFLTFRR